MNPVSSFFPLQSQSRYQCQCQRLPVLLAPPTTRGPFTTLFPPASLAIPLIQYVAAAKGVLDALALRNHLLLYNRFTIHVDFLLPLTSIPHLGFRPPAGPLSQLPRPTSILPDPASAAPNFPRLYTRADIELSSRLPYCALPNTSLYSIRSVDKHCACLRQFRPTLLVKHEPARTTAATRSATATASSVY